MLMEPIIIVFIKLMGAAMSGHWGLRETGTSRDYDTLVRSLGWHSGSGPGWQCECTAHTLPALCLWHAEREKLGHADSPAKSIAQKRHILATRTCSAANMAAPSDS